jgi:hypothetical protein
MPQDPYTGHDESVASLISPFLDPLPHSSVLPAMTRGQVRMLQQGLQDAQPPGTARGVLRWSGMQTS